MNVINQNAITQNAKALMLHWSGARKQIQFWLNFDKLYDLEVYAIIDWLKKRGLFRGYAMTGLRVMFAYHHKNVQAILDELPDLKEMLGQGDCDETKEMLQEILNNQRLLLERGIAPAANDSGKLMKPAQTGKQIAAPTFAMPVYEDDDEPRIVTRKDVSTDAGANFVKSLGLIQ